MTLMGLEPSAFAYVKFSSTGACFNTSSSCSNSEFVFETSETATVTAPCVGSYRVCHRQYGHDDFRTQTTPGVELTTFAAAANSSIYELSMSDFSVDSTSLTISAGPVRIKFMGAMHSIYSRVAFVAQGTTDCSAATSIPLNSGDASGQADAVIVTLPAEGNYSVCYTSSNLGSWEVQELVSVHVIPQATQTSVMAINCISPASCLNDGSIAAGVTADITFDGIETSQFTSVALTRSPDCSSVSPIPLLSGSTISLSLSPPGTYYVCYTTTYDVIQLSSATWLRQSSIPAISVVAIWDQASFSVTPTAGGGATVTVTGSGFHSSRPYSCRLRRGSETAISAATFISSTQLACVQPAWEYEAGFVDFELVDGSTAVRESTGTLSVFLAPTWTTLAPTDADKTGGTQLTLHGFGFGGPVIENATNATYVCFFSGNSSSSLQEISTNAVVVSPKVIECEAPAWSAELWASYSEDLDGQATLSLLSSTSSSAFVEVGSVAL
eukprot:1085965-Rhodomonas_salina.1